jgi:hypothetical protein
MMTRRDVLSNAVTECLKELYSWVTPKIDWDEFIKENKIYNEKYKKWESLKDKTPILEYCGPKPYEFYYLPAEIFNDIKESYVYAYKLNGQKELLDIIEILKNYCKEPIVDKYIEGENGFPGHRGYDHPDNLEKELQTKLREKAGFSVTNTGIENLSKELQDKFFEFLDMAGNFFNWNRDLNSFYMSVCLGASPNSNKQAVIDNWKKYRKQDIKIDEEQIKKEYYGEELD